MDIQYPSVQRVELKTDSPGYRFEKTDFDVTYMNPAFNSLGFTPGELVLATKRWLLVEGEVDKVVLEGFFPDELRANGVRVVPMHGSGNISYAFQVGLLSAIAARVSVLIDSDAPDGSEFDIGLLKSKLNSGYLEADLKQGGANSVLSLTVAQHSEMDIMFFLDPELLQIASFNGSAEYRRPLSDWNSAWSVFQVRITDGHVGRAGRRWRLTMKDFKEFLRSEYGVRINPETAQSVVAVMKDRGTAPEELSKHIGSLISPYAG